MSFDLSMRPIELKELQNKEHQAFMATVGFEERARFIAESGAILAKRQYACAFDQRKYYSYDDNLTWFKKAGYRVEERSDAGFSEWCREVLDSVSTTCSDTGDILTLCIDISSMSRLRIATLVASILEKTDLYNLDVDFVYAPATFSKPVQEDSPIITSGPVIDRFAGWSVEPEKACAAVFGLGYEPDKAVGAMEFLEPSEVWAFLPSGEDSRYDTALEDANRSLWDVLPENHIFRYEVSRPFECLAELESLVYGSLRTTRPVLIPFGPKIFTLACLLVATIHYPDVVVWRVSSGEFEPAINREANGRIVGLNVTFPSGFWRRAIEAQDYSGS